MMFRTIKVISVTFLAFLMFACAPTPSRESTGEYLDSTTITAKVKASLVEELGTQGFSIVVKTFKDEVQLSGFVNSQAVKQQAARVASSLEGVRLVRNNIVVK